MLYCQYEVQNFRYGELDSKDKVGGAGCRKALICFVMLILALLNSRYARSATPISVSSNCLILHFLYSNPV